ncbi:MAG: hypothetical protein HY402_03890 [Elusimicrobia bacterium]|nr:hypothetical protein [Elusimicrobiota bacterium]
MAVAVPLSAANLTVSVGFGGLWLRDLAMLATVMAVMLAGIRWLDHQETSLVKGLSVRFFLLVLALGAGALVVRFIDWSWIAASGASLSWLGFPLAGLAWVAQNGSESDGQPESASPLLHDRIVEGLKKAGLNPEDFVTDIRKLLAPGAEKNILERGWKKEESSQAGLRVYSLGDAVTFKTGQRATYALNGLVYLTTFAGPVMQAIAVDSSGKVVFNEIHRLDRGEAGVAGEFTSDVQVKDQSSAASAQNRGSSGELIEVPVGSFLTLLVFVAWAGFLSLHPNPVLPTWVFVLFSLGVFFSGAVFSASVAFRAVRWFNRGFYKMLLRSRAPDDPLPSDEEIDNMNFKGWAVGAAIAAFFVGGYLGLSYFMYLFKSLFAAGP